MNTCLCRGDGDDIGRRRFCYDDTGNFRRRSRYESWQMDKLAAKDDGSYRHQQQPKQKWQSQLHLNVPLNRRFRSTSNVRRGKCETDNCHCCEDDCNSSSSAVYQQDRWADLLFAKSNQNVAIWNRSAKCIVCVSTYILKKFSLLGVFLL